MRRERPGERQRRRRFRPRLPRIHRRRRRAPPLGPVEQRRIGPGCAGSPSADRTDLDALLDTEWWGVLSVVREGAPASIPTLFARDGDVLLLHGSTGAGMLGHGGIGARAAFAVTAMEAVKVAATAFDSSVRYRSAVLYGELEPVADEERAPLLDLLSERLLPGRTSEVRPMTRKEIAATNVLRLRIVEGEWVCKTSAGFGDAPDEESDAWQGLVPIIRGYGPPQRAPWCEAELPASVARLIAE